MYALSLLNKLIPSPKANLQFFMSLSEPKWQYLTVMGDQTEKRFFKMSLFLRWVFTALG